MNKRKIIFMSYALLLAGVAIFIACSKEHTSTNLQTTEEQPCKTCKEITTWLPANAQKVIKDVSTKNESGKDIIKETTSYQAEGYDYIGFSSNGDILPLVEPNRTGAKAAATPSVTYSCKCAPGEGSDASCELKSYMQSGVAYTHCVLHEGCKKCELKEDKGSSAISVGGFVNISAPISFAPVQVSLPYAFQAMYAYPQIQAPLNVFVSSLTFGRKSTKNVKPLTKSDGMYAPEGYKFTVLNVCGRAMITLMPEDILQKHSEAQVFDKMNYPVNNTLPEDAEYFFYLPPQNTNEDLVTIKLSGKTEAEFTIYNH